MKVEQRQQPNQHSSILQGDDVESILSRIPEDGKSHCELCLPKFYKPAYRCKIKGHLQKYHIRNGIKIAGPTPDGFRFEYSVLPCRLACISSQDRCHWHCPYCDTTICRTRDFKKHIEKIHKKKILSKQDYTGVPCTTPEEECPQADVKISENVKLSEQHYHEDYQKLEHGIKFEDFMGYIEEDEKEEYAPDIVGNNGSENISDRVAAAGKGMEMDKTPSDASIEIDKRPSDASMEIDKTPSDAADLKHLNSHPAAESFSDKKRPYSNIGDQEGTYTSSSVNERSPAHGLTIQLKMLENVKKFKREGDEQAVENESKFKDQLHSGEVGSTNCSESSSNITSEQENLIMKQLKSRTEWISDVTIDEAQALLRKKFPHIGGLYNASVMKVPHQIRPVDEPKFVQIVNMNGNHWITVSNIKGSEGTVQVYDSIGGREEEEDPNVLRAIDRLMSTHGRDYTIQWMNADKQSNGYDCGLHAIANATALCHGVDPTTCKWNQSEMRNHLKSCIQKDILQFPFEKDRRARRPQKTQHVPYVQT
ncbi:uncharacterized protein LOC144438855 [Glandiceps talaboti]